MPELVFHDTPISYVEEGAGDVVMLVHGWVGSGALWDLMLPGLSRRFRVIAPDLPGHGDSGIPRGFSFGLDAFSHFLEELSSALDAPRLTLVGHSMGGDICIHYAAHHPHVVERLVLMDSPACARALPWPARLPLLEHVLGFYSRYWRPSDFARMIKGSVRYPDRLPRDFLERASSQAHKLDRRALVETARGIRNADLDAEIGAIEVPVLIMHGDQDRSVKPAEAYRLLCLFKHSSLRMISDCGHCPNYEYPGEVNEIIGEFITGQKAGNSDQV